MPLVVVADFVLAEAVLDFAAKVVDGEKVAVPGAMLDLAEAAKAKD